MAFLAQSCGDDEEMSTGTSELAGTWKAESLNGDVTSTVVFGGMTTVTSSIIDGTNLNYTLVLTDDSFTTSGSYDIEASIEVQGTNITSSDSYSNVSGNGTYFTEGNEITVDGQFFELELNGMPLMSETGPVTATYNITNNVLTVTQNDVDTNTQSGVTTESQVNFVSTWRRQ